MRIEVRWTQVYGTGMVFGAGVDFYGYAVLLALERLLREARQARLKPRVHDFF